VLRKTSIVIAPTAHSGPGPPHYRGFTITHTHPIRLLWTGDQPEAETSTWQRRTLTKDRNPLPPEGFKPATPASERPLTHALGRAPTGFSFEDTKVH